MEWIGRIVSHRSGIATVEVARDLGCSTEGCAGCRDRWTIDVAWSGPPRIDEKVLVKPQGVPRRIFQWTGSFLAFSLTLLAAGWIDPRAVLEGPEERLAIVLGLCAGGILWVVVGRRMKGRLRYRGVALENPSGGRMVEDGPCRIASER